MQSRSERERERDAHTHTRFCLRLRLLQQILTQFPVLFDIVFPQVFQDWLDALAVISLDVSHSTQHSPMNMKTGAEFILRCSDSVLYAQLYSFIGIRCVTDINLIDEFTVTMIVPALGLLVIYISYRFRLRYVRRSMETNLNEKDAEQGETRLENQEEQYALALRKTRDQMVWLSIGWFFLVYTILCRTTFRSFACQDIDDGERSH